MPTFHKLHSIARTRRDTLEVSGTKRDTLFLCINFAHLWRTDKEPFARLTVNQKVEVKKKLKIKEERE